MYDIKDKIKEMCLALKAENKIKKSQYPAEDLYSAPQGEKNPYYRKFLYSIFFKLICYSI